MIKGLEITCHHYPHIETRLNTLKFNIQKSNYLNAILTEDRDNKSAQRAQGDNRRRRQGFDPRATVEMFNYLESLGFAGHQVNHGFTFSGV